MKALRRSSDLIPAQNGQPQWSKEKVSLTWAVVNGRLGCGLFFPSFTVFPRLVYRVWVQ